MTINPPVFLFKNVKLILLFFTMQAFKINKLNKRHVYCKSCAKEHKRKFAIIYTKISELNNKVKDLTQRLGMYE